MKFKTDISIDSGVSNYSGLTLEDIPSFAQDTLTTLYGTFPSNDTGYVVTMDKAGDLLIGLFTAGALAKYNLTTGVYSTVKASGIVQPRAICQTDTTDVLVSSTTDVLLITTAGSSSVWSTENVSYMCRATDKQSYYAVVDTGIIKKIDNTGTTLSTIATTGVAVTGIIQGWDGDLFIVDNTNDLIKKVTLGGTVTTFATLPTSNPYTLSILSNGNLICANNGNGDLYEITPSGVVTTYGNSPSAVGVYADLNGNVYTTSNYLKVLTKGGDKVLKTDSNGIVTKTRYLEDVQYLRFEDGGFSHNHNDSYEPIITAGTTAQYWRGDKTWQTLPPSVTYGTDNQIPVMNGTTEFDYSAGLKYDGTYFYVGTSYPAYMSSASLTFSNPGASAVYSNTGISTTYGSFAIKYGNALSGATAYTDLRFATYSGVNTVTVPAQTGTITLNSRTDTGYLLDTTDTFTGVLSVVGTSQIDVGVNDTTAGLLNLYGNSTTTSGEIRLYQGGTYDTSFDYYRIYSTGGGFYIAPNANTAGTLFMNASQASLRSPGGGHSVYVTNAQAVMTSLDGETAVTVVGEAGADTCIVYLGDSGGIGNGAYCEMRQSTSTFKVFGNIESTGTMSFVGALNGNAKRVIDTGDTWLRFNGSGNFTNGIYCGTTGVLRHDTRIEVGASGASFYANNSGNGWFSNDVLVGGAYTRNAHNTGYLEGSYNNVGGNSSQSNPIYVIGSSYVPDTTTLSNMYGIGYSEGSASFLNSTDLGTTPSNWGLYVAADGNARIFLDGGNGITRQLGVAYASNFTLNSDKRRKKKIKKYKPKDLGIKWKNFELKTEPGQYRVGVIAQELLETAPELVNQEDPTNYTVNSIDVLNAEMAWKDKQINDLTARVEKLELLIKKLT